MPERTFSIWQPPTLQNYETIFASSNYISFLWSLGLATLTVIILALICYPVAYGLNRVFGRWSMAVTLVFVIPLFVSENVRLYGWVLFLIKNGVLLGSMKALFGYEPESILFTLPAIILGMVYTYLPYMLFPMSLGVAMVPNEVREAAFDLGASRWQVFREVELPLSMPGIVIGFLLTFVLAVGAIAEAKVLGGQKVIPITHDIEIAFTYAQNWPLGAALAVLLMLVVGVLVLLVLRRFDLDTVLGRRRGHMSGASQRRMARADRRVDARGRRLPLSAERRHHARLAHRQPLLPVSDPALGHHLVEEDFRRHQTWQILNTSITHCALRDVDLRGDRLLRRARLCALRLARPLDLPETRAAPDLLPAIGARAGAAPMVQRARPSALLEDGGLRASCLGGAGGDAGHLHPGLQLRSGARGSSLRSRRSRWQVFTEITLPVLFPGIFSGCLFAFLLSWGNFPLSLYTDGADTTVPEFLYAKMVAGYTPGVPVLGTVATIGAVIVLLGGYALVTLVVRARSRVSRDAESKPRPERRQQSSKGGSDADIGEGEIRRRHRREQGDRQGDRARLREERREGDGRRPSRRSGGSRGEGDRRRSRPPSPPT